MHTGSQMEARMGIVKGSDSEKLEDVPTDEEGSVDMGSWEDGNSDEVIFRREVKIEKQTYEYESRNVEEDGSSRVIINRCVNITSE